MHMALIGFKIDLLVYFSAPKIYDIIDDYCLSPIVPLRANVKFQIFQERFEHNCASSFQVSFDNRISLKLGICKELKRGWCQNSDEYSRLHNSRLQLLVHNTVAS